MGTGQGSFGAAERLGVTLPAPCIGYPLCDGIGFCLREGSSLLTGVIPDALGLPLPVILTACPEHISAVEHWLKAQGLGDDIERWATATFFEFADVFEESGIDWHVLRQPA